MRDVLYEVGVRADGRWVGEPVDVGQGDETVACDEVEGSPAWSRDDGDG